MFWLYAVLLLVVAFVFVLYPFVRKVKVVDELDRSEENLRAYREGENRLSEQLSLGELTQSEHEQLLNELKLQLLGDSEVNDEISVTSDNQRPWVWLGAGAAVLVLFSFGLYYNYGDIGKVELREAMLVQHESRENTMRFFNLFEESLKKEPNNAEGWFQLGSGYMQVQMPERAVEPLTKALNGAREQGYGSEDIANLMSRLAQAKYFANGQKVTPEIEDLLANANALDSNNVLVMGMSGMIAFEKGDYQKAIQHWSLLSKVVTPEERGALEGGIREAKARLEAQGVEVQEVSVEGPAVKVMISLAPELAELASQAKALFVTARVPNGPPMPLAVMRLPVELPVEVILDDNAKMGPMAGISSAAEVEIVARLSMSGVANSATGDLIGVSAVVVPSMDVPEVQVTITELVE